MKTQNTSQKNGDAGTRKLAYASTIIGGGIVGTDYANWLSLHPFLGLVLGAIISTIITAALFHIKDDPDKEIEKFLITAGAIMGMIFGIYAGIASDASLLITAPLCAVIGAGLGQLVAGLLSIVALILLVISRGPIGAMLRETVSDDVGAFPSLTPELWVDEGQSVLDAFQIMGALIQIVPI